MGAGGSGHRSITMYSPGGGRRGGSRIEASQAPAEEVHDEGAGDAAGEHAELATPVAATQGLELDRGRFHHPSLPLPFLEWLPVERLDDARQE